VRPIVLLDGKEWCVEMVRMTLDSAAENDRRGRQRFSISAPLTVILGGREIPAYTRDLSNRGAYFYLSMADSSLLDHDFEFVVELPPEITLSSCCFIRCRGRAVRTENAQNDLVGMAVEILDYSILREPLVSN
jgi:hypothetical protein